MKIYYSIVDPYPAYRVDLTELFGVELQRLGLDTQWFMDAPVKPRTQVTGFFGQTVIVPPGGPRALKRFRYWFSDIARMLALRRTDVDAIQCRDKYIGSLVGLVVARIIGVPFFYWCSYPFPDHNLALAKDATGVRKLYLLAHGWFGHWVLQKVVMPRSRHVFVQSAQMKRDLVALGIKPGQMTPVLMGVASGMLDWAARNTVDVERGKVVYIGTLASVRKLDAIVRAFALVVKDLPQAKLYLVGDGDFPHEREALEQLVKQLGLGDSVVFTGFVPMEQAWLHAKSAAVCLSPFYPTPVLASASPTKLVEYMALGRPIVCNDHPEQSEVIKASGVGICVPWDERAFAHAISWVLQNKDDAELQASKGPEWVRNNRVYPKIAQEVYDVYKNEMRSDE